MFNKLKCFLGKHAYYIIKKLSWRSKKVGCKNCPKIWAMNDDVRIMLPWDEELEELYRFLNITTPGAEGMKDFLKSPIDNMSLHSLIIAYGLAAFYRGQYYESAKTQINNKHAREMYEKYSDEERNLFEKIQQRMYTPGAD